MDNEARNHLSLTILGQVRGGKNNMGVKNGRHYPSKTFAKFSQDAISQLRRQYSGPAIDKPCYAHLAYFYGDKRRRDWPMVMDSVWHCLERAGVVMDDCISILGARGVLFMTPIYDKENPRVEIGLWY